MRGSVLRRLQQLIVVAGTTVGCVDPAVDACDQQCEKRATCSGDVDVAQCRSACAARPLVGDDACVDAQLALQRCQVAQPCDAYVANTGCEAEQGAVNDACA